MTAYLPRLLTAATLLGLGAAPVPAAPPKVKDEARLFNEVTVREADGLIAAIDKDHKREVVVETYKSPLADRKAEFDKRKADANYVSKFFRDWADERFRSRGVDGVYVLMYRESPRAYRVVVREGVETRKKDFTDEDAREAERLMADQMKKHDDNGALIAGLTFIQTQMVANQKRVEARPVAVPRESSAFPAARPAEAEEHRAGSGIMGWLCPLVGILLIAWVVIGLVRAFTGAGRPPQYGYGAGGPAYGAPGYGGGGFMSNMFGGLFGAVAGNWMYDSFFRGGHSHGPDFAGGAYGAEPGGRRFDPMGGDDAGRPSPGGDGGMGGDFGDSGGQGGDFGGGDFGGGDIGGGDFGGGDIGGGDFGGGDFGGGDFGGGDF